MSFRAGQLVEWRYESRGGYGYSHWVPAVVVRDPRPTEDPFRRVTIDAQRADGTYARRSVAAKNLRDAEFLGDSQQGTAA